MHNSHDEVVKDLLLKFDPLSITLIQMKCKVTYQEAQRLHNKYVPVKREINNFPNPHSNRSLLNKYCCEKVSVAYLQKRLDLSFEETFKLLRDWRKSKPDQQYKTKFDQIRKYVKPPREVKVIDTDKRIKVLEQRIERSIDFLEQHGYTVQKK